MTSLSFRAQARRLHQDAQGADRHLTAAGITTAIALGLFWPEIIKIACRGMAMAAGAAVP